MKFLTKTLIICGSMLMVGCGTSKEYSEKNNIESYNYYSYYTKSNMDIEQDVTELLEINSQRDIDYYISDKDFICSDLKEYLETKNFYYSVDSLIKSVSVDSEYFDSIDEEYNDFKTIGYIVNATLYTDYDISDVLLRITYREGKIIRFEYIGI